MTLQTAIVRAVLITCMWFSGAGSAFADQTETTSVCVSAFAYDSGEEARADLLSKAKLQAVGSIFGEFVSSTTGVSDGVITSDRIVATSTGLIRMSGTPAFSNGIGLGEICVSVTVRATDRDFELFEETRLSKKSCLTDNALTTLELKEAARLATRYAALVNYEPGLTAYSEAEVLPLLKRVQIINEGFVTQTETYCVEIEGSVVPIEIRAFIEAAPATPKATGKVIEQWVSSIVDFSSEYGQGWQASTLIGPPTVTTCQDVRGAWAAKSPDNAEEFLFVGFDVPVMPISLSIQQNLNPGGVREVEIFGEAGQSHKIAIAPHSVSCPGETKVELDGLVDFPINRVLVRIDGRHASGWEEIDAIKLVGRAAPD